MIQFLLYERRAGYSKVKWEGGEVGSGGRYLSLVQTGRGRGRRVAVRCRLNEVHTSSSAAKFQSPEPIIGNQ